MSVVFSPLRHSVATAAVVGRPPSPFSTHAHDHRRQRDHSSLRSLAPPPLTPTMMPARMGSDPAERRNSGEAEKSPQTKAVKTRRTSKIVEWLMPDAPAASDDPQKFHPENGECVLEGWLQKTVSVWGYLVAPE